MVVRFSFVEVNSVTENKSNLHGKESSMHLKRSNCTQKKYHQLFKFQNQVNVENFSLISGASPNDFEINFE